MPAKRFWTLALALIGLAALAFPASAQTYTPTAPPLPDLPLTVKAGWSATTYAPGQQAIWGITITNPGPTTITAPGLTVTTAPTITWTDAVGGTYSVTADPSTCTVAGGTVSGTKHVASMLLTFPSVLTPQPSPIGWAYTFAAQPDGSWLVTLPAMDVAGGGGAAGGRVMFKVGQRAGG